MKNTISSKVVINQKKSSKRKLKNKTKTVGLITLIMAALICLININSIIAYFTSIDSIVNIFMIKSKYTVTYDSNTGTGTMNPQKVSYNVETNLTQNAYTKANFAFIGWNTESNGKGTSYSDGQSVNNLGDTILYAQWAIEYNITYDLAGGIIAASNPTTYTSETTSFTLNNPIRAGYTFVGWSGTDLIGDENKTVIISKGSTGNRTYTANWVANTYEIEFRSNGGTGTMSNKSMTYNIPSNLTANSFTNDDLYFIGWNTESDGTGTSYSDGQFVTNLTAINGGTIILYAQWKKLNAGDFIYYNANRQNSNGDTFATPYSYTTDIAYTGSDRSSTFRSSDHVRWKILNKDENTGTIEIIPADCLPFGLYLNGYTGFLNAVDILNDISSVYGHGYGAISSRSITMEDIEKFTNYDRTTFTNYGRRISFTVGNFLKEVSNITDEEGRIYITYENQLTEASNSSPVTLTQNMYRYAVSDYCSDTATCNTLFKFIDGSDKYYWIASTATQFYDDCLYNVGKYESGNITFNTLYSSKRGDALAGGRISPIVTLDSNIELRWNSQQSQWEII